MKKKKEKTDKIRLNKFISESHSMSRRKADLCIKEGKISLNGEIVTKLSTQIDPKKDSVKLNNKLLKMDPHKVYYMFHKPRGVVVSLDDPQGRLSLQEFIRSARIRKKVFPVGRLDINTSGLLLLTNDGNFSNKVIHPRYKVRKTYMVKIDRNPGLRKLKKLSSGVHIQQGRVHAEHVYLIDENAKHPWVKVVICDGKNHQIKQMFHKVSCSVVKLRRISIGRLSLSKLPVGDFKKLTPKDCLKIFS